MNEWLDIKDAVKDGELILGFIPHDCVGYITPMYWNTKLNNWQNTIDYEEVEPTHWMPHPSFPDTVKPSNDQNQVGGLTIRK